MSHTPDHPAQETQFRISLMAIGAAAGATAWLFIDWLPDTIENERVLLAVASAGFSFFLTWLALAGPVDMRRVPLAAVALAVVSSALLLWASLRHDTVGDFVELAYGVVAYGMILLIAIPFVGAGLQGRWRDYATLFDLSWTILVRLFGASVFTGLFWLLLLLSDELLKLVGIRIIEWLLDIEIVPFVLSGLVFGLAMAVVHELRHYISPYLVLRLLRLLTPLLLFVSAVFVLALPFQGVSGLVGNLSPAATLMSMAIAAITLVAVSVDGADPSKGKKDMDVQALAVLVPVLGAIAVWSIWVRVAQFGWTPSRLMAMTVAVLILAYGLFYLTAVARRSNWRTHIRTANIWVALGSLAVAAIWLTPLLNPERISARNQMALVPTGEAPNIDVLYDLSHEWGRPGKAALEAFVEDNPQYAEEVARVGSVNSRYQALEPVRDEDRLDKLTDILAEIEVIGAPRPGPDAFSDMHRTYMNFLETRCRNRTPSDRCLLLISEQDGAAVVLAPDNDVVHMATYVWQDNRYIRQANSLALGQGNARRLPRSAIEAARAGDFAFGPVQATGVRLGDTEIVIENPTY